MHLKFVAAVLAFCLIRISAMAAPAERSDTLNIRKTIIEFNITDFISKNISARCILDVKSNMNNVAQLNFDLEGLTVDSTRINGTLSVFTHSGNLLSINPATALNLNDTALVEVFYRGIPVQDATWGGFYYVGNYGFQMGVGFNAQPHSFGRTWHPCFDNFVERSSYEFFVTTTNDKMAVCNGLFLDSTAHPNATITWHWKLDEEIPSYLSSVAVCNYVLVKKILNGNNGPIDAWIACEAIDSNKVNGSFSHLQESFTMLENNFGTYSWPRVGYALVPFNAGAMEHATNIHIGKAFVDGTLNYETLIAHELSHHWWGDLVTCRTAGDMWLNEGFASYAELLHQEYVYGSDAYMAAMRTNHYNVLAQAHIADEGYRAVANMDSNFTYSNTVYNKGADMIHTMRSYLGDSLFFNGLTAFLDAHKFTDISSTDLRDFLSTYSGISMSPYFDNWILAPGFTHFSIDSSSVTPTGTVYATKVYLRQRKHHSNAYYSEVPLELGFYDAQMNRHLYHLTFNGRCMEFSVDLPFDPKMIVVDPDSRLSDAITEEWKKVLNLSVINMPQAKIRLYPKAMVNNSDSTLLRVEHSWIAPDRFRTVAAANGYILSNSRYWKIDAVNLANINGIIQFSYDGGAANSYLDSAWVCNTEDSMHVFYRKDATEEWQIANDSLKAGALNDKVGSIYVKEFKAGEYCLGIKKSNFTDPVQTDAPAGGCGLVSGVTGNIEKEHTVWIYPNPVHDMLQLRFSDAATRHFEAVISSINGSRLWQSALQAPGGYATLRLPSLPRGLYYLQLLDTRTHQKYVRKFVID